LSNDRTIIFPNILDNLTIKLPLNRWLRIYFTIVRMEDGKHQVRVWKIKCV